MPCTPERVWWAIQDGRADRGGVPWTDPPAPFDSLVLAEVAGQREAAGADM
jgi:hypothetical protein